MVLLLAFSFGCWVVAVVVDVVDVVVSHSLCCVVHWMDDQRSEESFLLACMLLLGVWAGFQTLFEV